MSMDIISKAKQLRRNLLETEANQLLALYGLPVLPQGLAKNEEEAVQLANKFGYPVVMKVVSPQIIHKTDAGGVKINIKNKEEVEKAYQEILANAKAYNPHAEIVGILVVPMAKQGTEVIIGMVRDEQFGPTIMFGLGGIFVEVFKDVTFRVAPLKENDAKEMIEEIKGYEILKGVRGEKSKDLDILVEILLKISDLAIKKPEIKEIDLNPIFVYEEGAALVDARILF